jgi:hypothetical protein
MINTLNGSGSPGTITFNIPSGGGNTSTITLGGDLPVLTQTATITTSPSQGVGTITTIDGNSNNYRIFATFQASLTLQDLIVQNGAAIGGSGYNGGGGGLGAGGGVFVDLGQSLTLSNTTIQNNKAVGGSGSAQAGNGGGGGGASFSVGNKNAPTDTSGSGGGDRPGADTGGAALTGGVATPAGYCAVSPCSPAVPAGGAGGSGGGFTGGAGGGSGQAASVRGSAGGYNGGGGGAASQPVNFNNSACGGGDGGGGIFGQNVASGGGYGSGGGSNGGGGGGGFGGGGGGAWSFITGNWNGGGGGFGGGGGGYNSNGTGGTQGGFGGRYGGNGANGSGGGGGGLGGAVFVGPIASMQIGDGVSMSGNSVASGSGGGSAGGGSSAGSNIFLFKGATLTFNGSNNLSTSFSIDGDATSPAINSQDYDSGVTISLQNSSSIVTFNGSSYTYQGGTTIASGYLYLQKALPTIGNVNISTSSGGLLQGVNTVATTGTFSNSGNLIVAATFNRGNYTSFANTGAVYLAGASGSITGSGTLSGTTLNVGKDPTSTISSVANTFAPSYALSFTNTNIYTGSALNSSSGFTGNMFVLGTGSFGLTGSNSGTSLTIGQDSSGTTIDNTTNFTASHPITAWGTINVNHGTFSTSSSANNVTAATAFSVLSTGTANLGSALTGAGSFSNAGTVNINTNGSIGTTGTFSNTGTLTANVAFNTTGFTNVANSSPLNSATIKMNGVVMTTNNNFINNGNLYLYNSGASISGALTSGTGALYIGYDGTNTYSGTNFTTNAAITQPTISVNGGTFTIDNAVTASTAFSVASTASATVNVASTLSGGGTGTFNNAGTMLFTAGFSTANFSGTPTNASTGSMKINNVTLTSNSSFTNNGNLYIYNTNGALSGALTSGSGTLYTGYDGTSTYSSTNFSNSGAITQPTISIQAGAFTGSASNTITASSAVIVAANTTATFNGSLTGTGTFSNSSSNTSIGTTGSFSLTGNVTNGSIFTNNGAMAIVQSVTGAGSLVNSSTGTMQLKTGAVVAQAITNQASGQLNVINSAQSAGISNAGTLTVNSGSTLTATGGITNTGNVNVNGAISMPGQAFNATAGTVTMAGNSSINGGSYTNAGTHTTNISGNSASNIGAVTTTGAINLATTQIVVQTNFHPQTGTWTLFTAGSGLLTPPNNPAAQITLPSTGTLFSSWSYNFDPDTIMTVTVHSNTVQSLVTPGINQIIAGVLDQMNSGNENAGQQALLNDVFDCTSTQQLNALIHSFMPDNNSNAVNVALQNAALNKVQTRAAGRREYLDPDLVGFTSGDITPNTSLWQSLFGSIARQHAHGTDFNEGYKAKSGGFLLGIDTLCPNNDVYGIAVGMSYTNVTEYSNPEFLTNITGVHGLLYGSNVFAGDYFLEWLLNAAFNINEGSRNINQGTGILSVQSSYKGALGGIRFNLGKYIDLNECLRLSQVNSVEYTYLYRPAYNETGSVAALHVTYPKNQNILTLGSGFRVSIPTDNSWLNAVPEARAIVTYDLINPGDAVTANFLVGSENFTVTSQTEKWAITLGADMKFNVWNSLQLEISYDCQMRIAYLNNTGSVKVKYLF